MGLLICCVTIFGSLFYYAFVMVFLSALGKKLRTRYASHIVKMIAPRAFSAMSVYKGFQCIRYPDLKNALPKQYLLFSNHQSFLDIPLLMSFLRAGRLRFVAKDELAKVPLVSQVIIYEGHALIPRNGSPSKIMGVLDSFAECVKKNNWIPVIFPEGTRSHDGTLGTFYAAGFRRLLEKAPMPVVVCVLDGGYKLASLDGAIKNLKGGKYRVKILKTFAAPQNKQEQVAILEEGKQLIQQQLDAWRLEETTQSVL